MTKRIPSQPPYGKFPRFKKEEQEFGPGQEDVLMCPDCSAVYFEKSWHHALEEYEHISPDKNIKFKLCPSDEMKKKGLFEGQVIIKDIPEGKKKDIIKQIENIGRRAYERDVLDRILNIKTEKNNIEVQTSENQLALSIGKQVSKSHKNSKIDTKFSDKEDVVRIRVWWPKS